MLIAKNISKRFEGVIALSGINLELHPGKVNAIIGENGAGKSTLMKIFAGVHTQYEGEIVYNGQTIKFSNPKDAEKTGIAIIHQELNLVPHLSICENIFLGREIADRLGMLNRGMMRTKTTELLSKLNLSISPDTKIAELKVGQQQLVEIARALYSNASVIIMDEPTSALSDKEIDNLFVIIRQLRTEGRTIVYISHKLKELFTIADRFVALRDGATIDSGDMQAISQDELIRKMTGRSLSMEHRGTLTDTTKEILAVKNVTLRHPELKMKNILKDISFQLHQGEILGLYGLMGAGRTELMETIFGLNAHHASGEILVNGKIKSIKSPADAMRAGIALVPEDRKSQGLILDQTIRSNISITILDKMQKWGIMLNEKREKELTNDFITRLAIKTSSGNAVAKNLSGGNQQKIVLAKWLATNPGILLLDEPTRGIDVNAKAEIYRLMRSLASEGMGIIMVSSELPEILAISDKVLVMCEGELTANIPIGEATEAAILKNAIHKN